MATGNDILLDVNGDLDLVIENGDFKVGNPDMQNIRIIAEAEQGQIRQFPLVGIGIRRMLNGTIGGVEKRTIQLQLQGDGYEVQEIVFNNGELGIKI